MFDWLKSWISRVARPIAGRSEREPLTLRRWDAAKTHRLNQGHWQDARGQSVNADLVDSLETLRARSRHEATTNASVEGVINTHVCDVIGPDGPRLQILSDDRAYNEAAEAVWRTWFRSPDFNGELSGVELLNLNWRSLWTDGEFINQIVVDRTAAGPVQTRLLSIDPARLATPTSAGPRVNVLLGVERTPTGRPTGYWFAAADVNEILASPLSATQVPAEDVIHAFFKLESGQARGVPLLSTTLQVAADLADYDLQVLDAARQAASMSVLLEGVHPSLRPLSVNESTDLERGTIRTLPPGWRPMMVAAQQPSTTYSEYRKERQGDLGRGQSMPAMIVRQDASRHNYSSARFDSQGYNRAVKRLRGWLISRYLDRLAEIVLREAERGGVLPTRPAAMETKWVFQAPAHVDPEKEARASTERLTNGTSTIRDECAAYGSDWEEIIEQRRLEAERLEQAGLYLPVGKNIRAFGRANKKEGEDQPQRAQRNGINGRIAVL